MRLLRRRDGRERILARARSAAGATMRAFGRTLVSAGRDLPLDPRLRTALALYAFAVVGLFLVCAPWTGLWNRAVVALIPTPLGALALGGWTRGLVSGLGALNLAVAAQYAAELWDRWSLGAERSALPD